MPETLRFRMEYWKDGNWYVGRLPQVPGVFSQGATIEELEGNIRDAYRLMLEEQSSPDAAVQVETREIEVHS
jgi:predicted RNase H-like HicB family nuclease